MVPPVQVAAPGFWFSAFCCAVLRLVQRNGTPVPLPSEVMMMRSFGSRAVPVPGGSSQRPPLSRQPASHSAAVGAPASSSWERRNVPDQSLLS